LKKKIENQSQVDLNKSTKDKDVHIYMYIYTFLAHPHGAFQSQCYITKFKKCKEANHMAMITIKEDKG